MEEKPRSDITGRDYDCQALYALAGHSTEIPSIASQRSGANGIYDAFSPDAYRQKHQIRSI